MTINEYLVSYGRYGDFGRFHPIEPGEYLRGDKVIVRSPQGLEIGVVMCPVTAGHTQVLSKTALGQLLRAAGGDGGGCSTCSSGTKKEDIAAYLLGLRANMERHAERTPLL